MQVVPSKDIKGLFAKVFDGSLDALMKGIDDLLYEGYSPEQIMNQTLDEVLNSTRLNDLKKARIFEKIAVCDKSINESARDDIQIYNMFASMMSIVSKPDYTK